MIKFILLIFCTITISMLLSIWWQAAINTIYIQVLSLNANTWTATVDFNMRYNWEPLFDFFLFHGIAVLIGALWIYYIYKLLRYLTKKILHKTNIEWFRD